MSTSTHDDSYLTGTTHSMAIMTALVLNDTI